MDIDNESLLTIRKLQQAEVTESEIYRRIARFVKKESEKKVLMRIADEEDGHAHIWHKYTNVNMQPEKKKVRHYALLARVFGYTFAIKLMENGERGAQKAYESLSDKVPEARRILNDEISHENELIAMLDEERLKYVGSMVLGLSDALVELTGTLAGLTFALQDTRLVALSGLITGVSATLSMASSEYLSAKSEGRSDAFKSCSYTGIAYCITVALMVLPYLLLPSANYALALIIMLAIVVAEIALFSYYLSVARDQSFKNRFREMAGISLGVAVLAFVIGLAAKHFLGVDI
ncbi:MAG: VIT1/CCC1 transporter family protein [Clostridia bacterium]|nr:VIT1/CCC1 transporter family protein [Clostridia bacterium]